MTDHNVRPSSGRSWSKIVSPPWRSYSISTRRVILEAALPDDWSGEMRAALADLEGDHMGLVQVLTRR